MTRRPGCQDKAPPGPTDGDASGTDGPSSTGATGAESSTEGPDVGPYDLFRCGFKWECQLSAHFFDQETIPSECAVELVRAGDPAGMLVIPYFVPFCSDWRHLILLRGDGTAVVQIASATALECDDHPNVLFSEPQLLCELDLPPDFAELDAWFPVFKNCAEGEYLTCDDARALLGE
jgi:hypothetical protein